MAKAARGRQLPQPQHISDSTRYFTGIADLQVDYPGCRVEDRQRAQGPQPIEVLQADVDQSVPRDRRKCAFAMALRRITGADDAMVLNRIAFLVYVDQQLIVRMRCPSTLARLVQMYDITGNFPLGRYSFYPIEQGTELGNGRKRKTGPHTSKRTSPPGVRMNLSYRRWDPSNKPLYGASNAT